MDDYINFKLKKICLNRLPKVQILHTELNSKSSGETLWS